MCGIVGLYAKTATTSAQLGRHAGRMLVEMGDRGPDSAGLAVYREPLAAGSTKLSLHARDGAPDWDALVAAPRRRDPGPLPPRRGPRARARRGRGRRRRGTARGRRRTPRGRGRRRRDDGRDHQGGDPPGGVRRALRRRRDLRHPRAGPHPHGDREPRHDRRLAPVLDRRRSLPRPQRVALQPQPAAPAAARPGHRVPDRERHRGRRGLRRVAAAGGRHAGARPGALPRRPRRLLHLRGRHGRRLRGPARPDRLQAGRDGRDGRLGRDGLGVPRAGRAAGRRRRARVGAGARDGLSLGPRARRRHDDVRPRGGRPARAQRGAPRPGAARASATASSTRAEATRSPSARSPARRSRSRATRATTAPG